MLRKLTIFVLLAFLFSVNSFAVEKKKWTVMVFLNADNNLEGAGIEDLNEMEIVGSSSDVNVICLMDRNDRYDTSNGNWTGAKIFYVKKDSNTHRITSPVIKDLGEINMGDVKELEKFVKFVMDNYPAEKYFLDIWNHGAGWKRRKVRGVSFDEGSYNQAITLNQLRDFLKDIKAYNGNKNLNILGFDACLMGMVETAYAMKDQVNVMIGAEETEPGDGWEYNYILKPLVQNPDMDEKELAKIVVEAYKRKYNHIADSTLAAVDLSKMDEFMENLIELADLLSRVKYKDRLKIAAGKTQSYAYVENKDLYNFCEILEVDLQKLLDELYGDERGGSCDDGSCALTLPASISSCKKLRKKIEKMVIANVHTGKKTNRSHGLAIFHPTTSFYLTKEYKNLYFCKESNWSIYLDSLFSKTFDSAVKDLSEMSVALKDMENKLKEKDDQILRYDYNEMSMYYSKLQNRLKLAVMKDVSQMKFKKFDYLVKYVKVNKAQMAVYKTILSDIKAFMIRKAQVLQELNNSNKEFEKRLNIIKSLI